MLIPQCENRRTRPAVAHPAGGISVRLLLKPSLGAKQQIHAFGRDGFHCKSEYVASTPYWAMKAETKSLKRRVESVSTLVQVLLWRHQMAVQCLSKCVEAYGPILHFSSVRPMLRRVSGRRTRRKFCMLLHWMPNESTHMQSLMRCRVLMPASKLRHGHVHRVTAKPLHAFTHWVWSH